MRAFGPFASPLIAIASVLFALAAPARADAPSPGFGARAAALRAPRMASVGPRRRHARSFAYGRRPGASLGIAPSAGGLPPFYDTTGGAAFEAGLGDGTPVGLSVYREAYIGRSILYNTPPETLEVGAAPLRVRY